MTRATLLHVLDRPTALGPAEVRELEQLAQAFPYCQTAHLLLAKAAHDQGTMLASQRLRRAATYAADRTLLRRLIEQVEPISSPEPATLPEPEAPAAAPEILAAVPVATLPEVAAQSGVVPAAVLLPAADLVATVETKSAIPETAAPYAEPTAATPALPAPIESAAASPAVVAIEAPATLPPAETVVPEPVAAEAIISATPDDIQPAAEVLVAEISPEALVSVAEQLPVVAVEMALPAVPSPASSKTAPNELSPAAEPAAPEPETLIDLEGAAIEPVVDTAETTASLPVSLETPAEEAATEPADEWPAQAPAIRPPVEVGEARFEYGLATAPAPPSPVYELPGLVDEWASAAVTLSLGSPGVPEILLKEVVADVPAFTPSAFTGDTIVGYAFGESSRLGYSMQLLDLLAAQAEAAETITSVVAAAQPPAGALPPAGAFFEPDPLLLDHWATHRPLPPALPSSLDLINNFLKRQPRLTRPAMLPPAATHQADLSVRSTRAEPDLVSENLARIFVRQGRTARAIEIYEKLMVKHPEKMAYFAAQIQSLQPSA